MISIIDQDAIDRDAKFLHGDLNKISYHGRPNKDSITVNMVVKVHSDKYLSPTINFKGAYIDAEISVSKIQELIESGEFTIEFIPAVCTTQSTGTLIIEEKLSL